MESYFREIAGLNLFWIVYYAVEWLLEPVQYKQTHKQLAGNHLYGKPQLSFVHGDHVLSYSMQTAPHRPCTVAAYISETETGRQSSARLEAL